MLALTPAPLETAGERAFFAELTRWDTGGSVRAAVVASVPRFDDGPLGRRISDAVLFVPEGLAVVRVVEVERQSGTVTATPDGAWTIGPPDRPGEVLQLSGGGSSPLDGLMRAGMDTAVRLRRAGLEPGRIARLTVLVGGVSGLQPADGDLGEGDQVATLEPRSLLLGIARASRYAGRDNPRLWTTADVRAALEALELTGRGPSVEELNGEAFPYSPYVLRRPELLTPAALASVPASAAPEVSVGAARPVAVAARPAAAPASGWAPAPAPVRDTVAVDLPAGPPTHDTGGIGGLFAGAEEDEPPSEQDAAPAGRSGPPATAVLPVAAPEQPPVSPTAPVHAGPPLLDDEDDEDEAQPRRPWLLVVAALAAVVLLAGGGWALLGGGGDGPSPGTAASGADTGAEAADPTPTGPEPGDAVDIAGRTFTAQALDLDASCANHAYGEVAAFFAAAECSGLSRALYATQIDGRAVVVSVARIRMPDTATARDLQSLADSNGTGNVNDLLREGVRYPGGPEELSGAEYASAVSGPTVTIVESSWVQPGAGDAAAIDAVASDALALETPPLD